MIKSDTVNSLEDIFSLAYKLQVTDRPKESFPYNKTSVIFNRNLTGLTDEEAASVFEPKGFYRTKEEGPGVVSRNKWSSGQHLVYISPLDTIRFIPLDEYGNPLGVTTKTFDNKIEALKTPEGYEEFKTYSGAEAEILEKWTEGLPSFEEFNENFESNVVIIMSLFSGETFLLPASAIPKMKEQGLSLAELGLHQGKYKMYVTEETSRAIITYWY